MLNSLTLLHAMNGIHEEDVVMAENRYFNSKNIKKTRKTIQIILIAAVLISLFTVGAYALGFLGTKAIVIPETETETGEVLVSITQPQAVPEEIDREIGEKVENARAAWSEWRNWRETSSDIPREPAVFTPPEGASASNYIENEDGSITIYFFDEAGLALIHEDENGEPDFSAAKPVEVRIATAEEAAAEEAWHQYVRSEYGDFDFNYDIHSEVEAKKLEEIAEKYGLQLRHGSTLLWSKETAKESDEEFNTQFGTDFHTDTSDPRFLTNRELCDRISDIACHGNLFRENPYGFDKVYYFDEGTFCVSYFQELADGNRVHCYGYNSMYATLSSGREVVSRIGDPESFQVRTHTAPDGTELAIMQKGNEAFIYVYLEDSFFEMHVECDRALSNEDVDAVADNLNYSKIGK